jgi:hypothetical protein
MRHDRISGGTNLRDLLNVDVPDAPSANQVLTWSDPQSAWVAADAPGAVSGEANTIVNGDSGGQALFIGKTGVNLQLRNLNSQHSAITVLSSSGNHRLDLNLIPGQISHADLSAVGSNSHAQIDDHLGTAVGVHGLAGSAAGVTDTQTFTNKTINTSANTLLLHSTRPFVMEDPGDDENVTWFKTSKNITIKEMFAVLRGSATPSLQFNVRHGLSRSGSGTEIIATGPTLGDTDTGTAITSFADATIPAGSWMWVTTSAKSGNVNEVAITFDYTEDD